MKKGLIVLVMLSMLFSLVACGKSDVEQEPAYRESTADSINSTKVTESIVKEAELAETEGIEESNIPEGWEMAPMRNLPDGLSIYFNPKVLTFVELSETFSNADGQDLILANFYVIHEATAEDYLNNHYNALVEETLNPKRNVVMGEIETSTCAGYTIHKATYSYELKQYDLSGVTDELPGYSPEEMDKLFPIIWVPKESAAEIIEVADGIYMKLSHHLGDRETLLEAIVFDTV